LNCKLAIQECRCSKEIKTKKKENREKRKEVSEGKKKKRWMKSGKE
jgi:hypothetical protein